MKRYSISVAFLFVSLLAVRAEDFISGYHVDGKYLLFGGAMRGSDGNLKPFDRMSPEEIATIYHELWHAYFIECDARRKGDLFLAFSKEVDRLYADFPPDKRMEMHEEAVADFIDAVVATYVSVRRFLAPKTPERRAEIREGSNYLRVYTRLFDDSYTGYYTKSVKPAPSEKSDESDESTTRPILSAAPLVAVSTTSVSLSSDAATAMVDVLDAKEQLAGFIAAARRIGLPVKYLKAAARRLRGVVFLDLAQPPSGAAPVQSDVVWASASLAKADMRLVEKTLFEGILIEDAGAVFAEKRLSHPKERPPNARRPTSKDRPR